MSFFPVLCKQSIHEHRVLRCKSMKKSNCESLKVAEAHKMRRLVFVLVLCSLIIVINSVFSESLQRWQELVKSQERKSQALQLDKYQFMWKPSDITVTFKKDISNITSGFRQGRARVTSLKNRSIPLVTPTPKTRTNDALARELEVSGN